MVPSADEGIILGAVTVHPVDRGRLFLPVNGNSFVESFVVLPKHRVPPTKVLVSPLYNFNSVIIEHPKGANAVVSFIQVVHKGPGCDLGPVKVASKVVFDNKVLVSLKSKTRHTFY